MKMNMGAEEMVLQLKALSAKHDDLSSIPRMHMVGEKKKQQQTLQNCLQIPICMLKHVRARARTHVNN